jgi:hypothetical protein
MEGGEVSKKTIAELEAEWRRANNEWTRASAALREAKAKEEAK